MITTTCRQKNQSRTGIRACLILLAFPLLPTYAQDSRFDQAQALVKQGRAEEALPILLDLYRSGHFNANLCQQIGIAYTQLQDLNQAERFYREAVRLNPQFWPARKNLGTVLWFLDRKDESEREFNAVTRVLPADPVPHLYLGLAAHARGEFQAAKTQFERAGPLASENPEVVPAVFESYLAAGDMSFPDKVVQRLNSNDNPDPALATRVAGLLLHYGHAKLAVPLCERVVLFHKDSGAATRMLAEAYDRQGKPEQAYRAYSRSIEADPGLEDTYIDFAEFASAHGNNDYASQIISRGLERLPQSARLLFEKGILYALNGDRDQAESNFVRAGGLKPDWTLPLLALGVSQLEAGEAGRAVSSFRHARAVDPNDFRAHYLYASALARENSSDENRAEAIAALRKAVELNPRDARSHAQLGQLQLAAGKPEAATIEWQTTLKIDPENTTALYQLGLLYRKQGKTAAAEHLLQTFQRVKARKHHDEESLVQMLRVVPEKAHQRPIAASDSSTRPR